MKAHWSLVFCAFFVFAGLGMSDLHAQDSAVLSSVPASVPPSVLHIMQLQTTSKPNFPTYLAMYHLLNGATSPVDAVALNVTISLKNFDPTFSEVLFLLVYWQ